MLTKQLLVLSKLLPIICLSYTVFLTVISFINLYKIPNLGSGSDDKIYHFIAYAILTILWLLYFIKKNIKKVKQFLLLLLLIAFGITIEFLQQKLNPNRQFEWFDMLANTTGVIFGNIFVILLRMFKLKF